MKLVSKKNYQLPDITEICMSHSELIRVQVYQEYDIEGFYDYVCESGATNMFGAATYMVEHFDADLKFARWCLQKWMDEFSARINPGISLGCITKSQIQALITPCLNRGVLLIDNDDGSVCIDNRQFFTFNEIESYLETLPRLDLPGATV